MALTPGCELPERYLNVPLTQTPLGLHGQSSTCSCCNVSTVQRMQFIDRLLCSHERFWSSRGIFSILIYQQRPKSTGPMRCSDAVRNATAQANPAASLRLCARQQGRPAVRGTLPGMRAQ